jgi:hypothetical protein
LLHRRKEGRRGEERKFSPESDTRSLLSSPWFWKFCCNAAMRID